MGLQIEDGGGTGRTVKVTSGYQLKTRTESHHIQHHHSRFHGEVYQVISTDTGITAATQTLLHIKNTDPTKVLVIKDIRMQAITDTASKPVVGEYFEAGFGRTVASGGEVATPVNLNRTSGNVASVTCTGVDPVMAGTFIQIDKQYNQASGDEYIYENDGSIVLGLNDTFEIRLGSAGAGEAKVRVTFIMMDRNGD